MTYRQYIEGQICLAKYDQGKAEAVDKAFSYVGQSFPKNNAAAMVLFAAISNQDTQTISVILEKMQALKSQVPAADIEYLDGLIALATAGN